MSEGPMDGHEGDEVDQAMDELLRDVVKNDPATPPEGFIDRVMDRIKEDDNKGAAEDE
jgi:hypothetical protein